MSTLDKKLPQTTALKMTASARMVPNDISKDHSLVSSNTSDLSLTSATTTEESSSSDNTHSESPSDSDVSESGSSLDGSSDDSDSDTTSSADATSGEEDGVTSPITTSDGMANAKTKEIAATIVTKVPSESTLINDFTVSTPIGATKPESDNLATTMIPLPTDESPLPTTPPFREVPSQVYHRIHGKVSKSKASDLDAPVLSNPDPIPIKSATTAATELAPIGWGDVVQPATWDWQTMPLDCTGILEEQRRTVFYEFRDHGNGEGEWVIPSYSNPPNYHDSEWEYRRGKLIPREEGSGGRGRDPRDYTSTRGTGVREMSGSQSILRDELEYSPTHRLGGRRGRGGRGRYIRRARGRLYQPPSHPRSHPVPNQPLQAVTETETKMEMVSPSPVRSIIDIPNDPFDTVGLVSPNPSRPSLPIIEHKDEVKQSSAWTKEGKREREMSSLILPRPEKITMPAAIYPRPTKLGGRTMRVMKADGTPERKKKTSVEEIVPDKSITVFTVQNSSPQVDKAVVKTEITEMVPPKPSHMDTVPAVEPVATGSSVAAASLDAAQLLLQFVNLLRDDDKALGVFKSLVDSINPTASAASEEAKLFDPRAATPSIARAVVRSSSPNVTLPQFATSGNPVVIEPRVEAGAVAPLPSDVPIDRPKKDKSSKDKIKSHDRPHKSKSKSHSKDAAKTAKPEPTTSSLPAAAPAIAHSPSRSTAIDEDLTSDELWYQVPDARPTDSDSESLPHNSLKLQDIKTPPRAEPYPGFLNHNPTGNADPRVNRKLKYYAVEKHRTSKMRSRSPSEGKKGEYGNKYGSSDEAYRKYFPVVDAQGDLGIESMPKGSFRDHVPVLAQAIDIKSKEIIKASASDPAANVSKEVNKGKPVVGNSTASSSTDTGIETPTKAAPDVPVVYDFNPPSPRRVTRRVVLSSKDTGTQTSPPATPSPAALARPDTDCNPVSEPRTEPRPRPEAIHHAHYYNTVPRDTTRRTSRDRDTSSKRSKSKHDKKPCPFTAETLPEYLKSRGGSDAQVMENLKSVDANDDLMIVSKPKGHSAQTIPEEVTTFGVKSEKTAGTVRAVRKTEMVVAAIDTMVPPMVPPMVGVETSALYALLAAPKQDLEDAIVVPIAEDAVIPAVEKKRKKEKREKNDKREKKEKKGKSKSKFKQRTANDIDSPTLPTGNGDILGDLIGDEISNGKWSILNPTSP